MTKISFILIALMIVMAFTLPVKVNAGNPGQTSTSESTIVSGSSCDVLCAPLTSLTVNVYDDLLNSVCMSCPTWYISVWEFNSGGSKVQIGAGQAFSTTNSTYSWIGLNWDQINYPCILVVWHFIGTPCNSGNYSDVTYSRCYPNVSNPFNVYDFYPCQ